MTKTYILDSVAQAIGFLTEAIENQAVVTGGTSGTDTITVPANSQEGFAWATVAGEPNAATWPTGTYHLVFDVSATGADLFYQNLGFYRSDSTLATSVSSKGGTLSPTSGTGLITGSASWSPLGSTASDRYTATFRAANSNLHKNQDLTLNLGTSTEYMDGPWTTGPVDMPYRNPYPQLLAH